MLRFAGEAQAAEALATQGEVCGDSLVGIDGNIDAAWSDASAV